MTSRRPTKEFILAEVQRLASDNGGVPLGKERFEAATGISESVWIGRYWVRWSDLIVEAGFQPNTFQGQVFTDDDLVELLAGLTRDFGQLPTAAQIRFHKLNRDAKVPNDKVFMRLGSADERARKVYEFAVAHPDYADVAAILRSRVATLPDHDGEQSPSGTAVSGYVYLIKSGEFHKIGMTNHLGRRMFQIELQLPEKAELVHHIETDDPRGIEAYWHNRFKESRANGEWFKLHPADIAAFKRRTYM